MLVLIRKHGNSGKHLSGGERPMFSGFQVAAQVIEDRDENALVSFSRFYNTVHIFLDSTIRRVIERGQTAVNSLEEMLITLLPGKLFCCRVDFLLKARSCFPGLQGKKR